MFGFLNIYKPKGMTSHDVVSYLRKITKIKQIGHTGTLDPFAEGVLPVALGKATRLIEYLKDDKSYTATVQFGKSTTTYDVEGEVVKTTNLKTNEKDIKETLKSFEGDVLQKPPIYSAIKKNGKKLYEYARKGEIVEVEARKIFIEKICLDSFDEDLQVGKIFVKCSKGTYIRSIANDLGDALKTGGYLTALVRNFCGDFFLEDSVNLDDLKTIEAVETHLISPLKVLPFKQKKINENEHKLVAFGQALKNENFTNDDFIILIYGDKINAIAKVKDERMILQKVFNV